jgi:hypothetical protein
MKPSFASFDCVDIVSDEPGDTTVRPLRPHLLQLALAERERIARWQQEMDSHQATDKTGGDLPEGKNGTS